MNMITIFHIFRSWLWSLCSITLSIRSMPRLMAVGCWLRSGIPFLDGGLPGELMTLGEWYEGWMLIDMLQDWFDIDINIDINIDIDIDEYMVQYWLILIDNWILTPLFFVEQKHLMVHPLGPSGYTTVVIGTMLVAVWQPGAPAGPESCQLNLGISWDLAIVVSIQKSMDWPSGYDIHSLPWKIPYKWRFLAGKIIYKWAFFPQIHGFTLWYINIDPGRQGLEDSHFH